MKCFYRIIVVWHEMVLMSVVWIISVENNETKFELSEDWFELEYDFQFNWFHLFANNWLHTVDAFSKQVRKNEFNKC